MAQAADQMNARVSPYLALLDELHKEIPAMSRSVNNPAWRSYKGVTYLNDRGEEINPEKLSPKAEQLLEDYKMVQYDISVGKNYLFDAGFMDVPQK